MLLMLGSLARLSLGTSGRQIVILLPPAIPSPPVGMVRRLEPFMHIDREALFQEWELTVKRWAKQKFKTLESKGCPGIKDLNALECDAIAALHQAAQSWPGAGPFEGYLRAAVKNSWTDGARRERRRFHGDYPMVRDNVGDPESDERGADLGFGADPVFDKGGEQTPVFHVRAKGYRGGDSIVLKVVMQRDEAESILRDGLAAKMRALGYLSDDINSAIRDKDRRWQQQDRRHPEFAQLRDPEARKRRFDALFKDLSSETDSRTSA